MAMSLSMVLQPTGTKLGVQGVAVHWHETVCRVMSTPFKMFPQTWTCLSTSLPACRPSCIYHCPLTLPPVTLFPSLILPLHSPGTPSPGTGQSSAG
jgi:hypothetical protein